MEPIKELSDFREAFSLSEHRMSLLLGKAGTYLQNFRYLKRRPSPEAADELAEFMDRHASTSRSRPWFRSAKQRREFVDSLIRLKVQHRGPALVEAGAPEGERRP